jgi:DNA (cytosine-5)-methyltransferase 1
VTNGQKYTFIDLFAGIGGIRLGFENTKKTKCIYSSEWDEAACKTYEANFHEKPVGDITAINPVDIPDHDILVAGFPCQPFSIAGVSKNNALGKEHGFKHATQGNLFFNLAAIIDAKRPKAFLLENVKNLKNHDQGRTFSTIQKILVEQLGYHIYYKVIDGRVVVPQHRERIYIVGFREPISFSFPEIEDKKPKVADILESDVDPKYTLSNRLWEYLQYYAAKHREKGNGFGYGIADVNGVTRTLSARYYKDGSEILIAQENKNPRRLTPRECARLMGFPDTFDIVCSDTRAYRQFGNSVVVPVIQAVAEELVKCLSNPEKLVEKPYNLRLLEKSAKYSSNGEK